ncbi:MAG: hypothetical protein F6K25_28470 [Okeania sp. SIO2G4]|uniref:hypothetical protein n=1 Tax=unclassified Okeania TaxID=2634635 RepID=UPI0013B9F7B7|nr:MULTISPECIES: hypothetical protein [unclassified Okeania]NEP75527.1 hypothetical protein [Okeania sp. SIO2G5]NEP96659.1 hypothetical protein [Okeania sp. SIO2F5]NEQ94374.1 hypothetical protein [Okeania sp. SIO2G4]
MKTINIHFAYEEHKKLQELDKTLLAQVISCPVASVLYRKGRQQATGNRQQATGNKQEGN